MNELNENIYIEENEIKYKKPIGRVFLLGFLVISGTFMLLISLGDILEVLIHGNPDIDLVGSYAMLIFSSFCLLISNGALLSYFGNEIIESESFITIRRAAIGKIYTISKRCIMAKTTVFTSSKGIDNYQIILCLKSGKKINTGLLNCKADEFYKIDQIFQCRKITNGKELRDVRAELKKNSINEDDLAIKSYYFTPILTFFPLVFLIIEVILLST